MQGIPADGAPRPTQPLLAAALGLSQSTVSLALKGDPRVSAATRARVRAKADELGYEPDPLLHALTRRRQAAKEGDGAARACLAWVTNWPKPGEWRKPVALSYHRGAVAEAAKLGFRVEEFDLRGPGMTAARLRDILLARGVRGILLPPQPRHATELEFDFAEFSAVSFGYTLSRPKLNFVCSHHARSLATALRRLRALGYRRIGLVVERSMDTKVENVWSSSYLGTMFAEGRDHPAPLLLETPPDGAAVSRWVRRERVDAILVEGTIARACLGWLKAAKIRVPDDVAVACINTFGEKSLAGTDQRLAELGRAAVEMLTGMLYRFERGVPAIPRHLFLEGIWCDGPTAPGRDRRTIS